MGKCCSPATALPELQRGNKYITILCTIRGGLGGGILFIVGMSVQLQFWVSFLEAREATLKKKQVRWQDHKLGCDKL
jgi:hypothetical protein